jgi:hypothetical protein
MEIKQCRKTFNKLLNILGIHFIINQILNILIDNIFKQFLFPAF